MILRATLRTVPRHRLLWCEEADKESARPASNPLTGFRRRQAHACIGHGTASPSGARANPTPAHQRLSASTKRCRSRCAPSNSTGSRPTGRPAWTTSNATGRRTSTTCISISSARSSGRAGIYGRFMVGLDHQAVPWPPDFTLHNGAGDVSPKSARPPARRWQCCGLDEGRRCHRQAGRTN